MTSKVQILGKESIIVGNGISGELIKDITTSLKVTRFVIVTDDNVAQLHLKKFLDEFKDVGVQPLVKIIPAGEETKCRGVKESLEDWMLSNHCGRDTCLIALGGGVVGDLCGFVASTYLRGIPVVQVPTTLLAMVDSSIGGKTGLDTPHGKNLIGSFYQPIRVYIDMEFLKTLPERQLWNGMAEVIKTAAIWSNDLFKLLESSTEKIFNRDTETLGKVVLSCVQVKAEVVSRDEKESGLRELLNFGHTIGHGIEALYQPDMLHGEAVAIGLAREAEISHALGHLSETNLGRLIQCLQDYNLSVATPSDLDLKEAMAKMAVDKKNKGGKKYIVMITSLGKTLDNKAQPIDDNIILRTLSRAVTITPPGTPAVAILKVPGSKSISNRALVLSALGSGKCSLTGLLASEDTAVMPSALMKLLEGVEM